MMDAYWQRRGGRAGGLSRVLLAVLLGSTSGLAIMPAASAFELFGIHLWGEKKADPDIVDPLKYSVELVVTDGDAVLKEKLDNASALVQDAEDAVSGSLGLMSKARSDRERLVAALYSEARYEGVVTVAIDGKSIDDLPPDAEFDRSATVPVTITVEPGQLFKLGGVALKGDAVGLVAGDYGLERGGDAGADNVLKGEALIVRTLKEQGRPLADVSGREVVANHDGGTLDVDLVVAAGPVAGYGETTVTGAETVDADFTAYMAGLKPGEIYSPQDIEDARDRLLGLGVFSSVTVKEATALDAAGAIPIGVEVSERKMRYYGLGATFSSTDGLGLEGYWGHRNLFGRAESLRIEGSVNRIGEAVELSEISYNAAILFEKPGIIAPDSKFYANLRAISEHPDAYDRFSIRGETGLSYQFTKSQSASVGVAVEYSSIEDVLNPEGLSHVLASIPIQYTFDNRDDRLNPTEGIRALAYLEPTYDMLTGSMFVKMRGEASTYYAIDEADRFVLAGRLAAGAIVGAELADVPADRRFYSGGGGSVRGYAYQGIGPKGDDGTPTGGLSFSEASLEFRVGITEKLAIVPFVDVGTVSEHAYLDFSEFRIGAGVGVRYLTPFGPLRIDAGVPLNPGSGDPTFGIYAGVGQAF